MNHDGTVATSDRPGPDPVPAGVLAPPPAGTWSLSRLEPSPGLEPYVGWLWSVCWDLRGHGEHVQSVLPHPSAHLVVEEATATVHGPVRQRFDRTLRGVGQVVGLRFQPAGLRPFLDHPVSTYTDISRPARSALPGLAPNLSQQLERAGDATAAMRALEAAVGALTFDRSRRRTVEDLNTIVDHIVDDRSITDLGRLSAVADRHPRQLQRSFADYIGLSPTAVIRRYRLQEAASAALSGEPVDWAAKAAELGYYDQAHLTRHFTQVIGTPPAAYARSHADPSG